MNSAGRGMGLRGKVLTGARRIVRRGFEVVERFCWIALGFLVILA
jgi:hypothetical protein